MNRNDSICLKEPEQHISGDRLFETFFIIIIVIINASLREWYLSKNLQYIRKTIENKLWYFIF